MLCFHKVKTSSDPVYPTGRPSIEEGHERHVSGASLGMVVSLPLCGKILSQLGWPAVFYTSGALALVWSLAWFVLVFETPAQHPRLGTQERSYLARNLAKTDPEVNPYAIIFTF